MKILFATDASTHSQAMIKKFADRVFTPKTKVLTNAVYEKYS